MAPSMRTPTRPRPLQVNVAQQSFNGFAAPILLGKGNAKQYMSLPQDEDNFTEENPAVARAVAQARAKRGPVVLIQTKDDSDDSLSSEDSEEDSDDSAPGLIVAGNSSSSSSSDDSESESDDQQEMVRRRPFSTLRKAAMSAPAHVTRFNKQQFVIADSSEESSESSDDDDEPQQPLTARRVNKSNVDYVKQYQSVVVKEETTRRSNKPSTPVTAVPTKTSSANRGTRSSTYLSRREAAIEWIKSQLVPAAPVATATVQSKAKTPIRSSVNAGANSDTSSSEDESDSGVTPTVPATSNRRVLLSSMSEEEQKRALQARANTGRPSLSERRASATAAKGPKPLASLNQLSSHNTLGHELKAQQATPTTVTKIAPSPGTPSLGWAHALKSMPAATPREPFVARCGGIEIRITPPTPRPVGFSSKVPGVTLRHTFAPPPGSVPWTPSSPRLFGDDEALSPPPFDVAPGRNIIMQRRAEQQLQQLKLMAEQQMKSQNGMAFAGGANSPTSQQQQMLTVNRPSSSNARRAAAAAAAAAAAGSPRGTPDTPLPPRASATVAQMQNRRQAATLQTAIASPQQSMAPRAKPIYIPPGQNGFRSYQLTRSATSTTTGSITIEAPRSALLPRSGSDGESKREAGRMMLNRLGQRSAVPQSAV